MDEVKISTGFMKGLIAKAIAKVLREKLGVVVDITLNDIYISHDDKGAHIRLNVKADMEQNDLAKITSSLMD